jgi:hypothetical protein
VRQTCNNNNQRVWATGSMIINGRRAPKETGTQELAKQLCSELLECGGYGLMVGNPGLRTGTGDRTAWFYCAGPLVRLTEFPHDMYEKKRFNC